MTASLFLFSNLTGVAHELMQYFVTLTHHHNITSYFHLRLSLVELLVFAQKRRWIRLRIKFSVLLYRQNMQLALKLFQGYAT